MTRLRLAASFAAAAVIAFAIALSAFVGCASSSSTNDAGGGRGGQTGAGAGGSAGGLGGTTGTGSGGSSIGGTGGYSGGVDAATDAMGTGTGGHSGAGGASAGCSVIVTRLSPVPMPMVVVEDGPNATVRMQATLSGSFSFSGVGGAGGSQMPWQWTVTYTMPGGGPPFAISPSAMDNANGTIDFPVVSAGTYSVKAVSTVAQFCSLGSTSVLVQDPGPMQYQLRATATGYPIQNTKFTLGDPLQKDLLLDKGTTVNVSTQSPAPNAVPLVSYVRITEQGSSVSVDGDTSRGALTVPIIPASSYDVLVFPPDPYPPKMVTWSASNLQSLVILDQGTPVDATTLDPSGKPVVMARMVLHSGSLTSTPGMSKDGGPVRMWVQPGTMAMDIVPPIDSGLPSAAVGEGNPATDPGIPIGAATPSLNVSMKWDPVNAAPLTIVVHAPGGATVAGARVRATAQAAPGPVGTLIVQPFNAPALPPFRATGTTDVETVTDATGTAPFMALPIGAYTVMVIPPSSNSPSNPPITASSLAITSTPVTVATGGPTKIVTLSVKSTLTGMLMPVPDSAGTLVTAIDHTVTASGAVVSATVGTDGTYRLFVDPGRSYELLAQPPLASGRGRMVLAQSFSSATLTIPPATLPLVHTVTGKILDSRGTPSISNTLVQAFCYSTSSRCLDATFPLAETVSDSSGAYTLMLPDPPAN